MFDIPHRVNTFKEVAIALNNGTSDWALYVRHHSVPVYSVHEWNCLAVKKNFSSPKYNPRLLIKQNHYREGDCFANDIPDSGKDNAWAPEKLCKFFVFDIISGKKSDPVHDSQKHNSCRTTDCSRMICENETSYKIHSDFCDKSGITEIIERIQPNRPQSSILPGSNRDPDQIFHDWGSEKFPSWKNEWFLLNVSEKVWAFPG